MMAAVFTTALLALAAPPKGMYTEHHESLILHCPIFRSRMSRLIPCVCVCAVTVDVVFESL